MDWLHPLHFVSTLGFEHLVQDAHWIDSNGDQNPSPDSTYRGWCVLSNSTQGCQSASESWGSHHEHGLEQDTMGVRHELSGKLWFYHSEVRLWKLWLQTCVPGSTPGDHWELVSSARIYFLLELTGNKSLLTVQNPQSVKPAVHCHCNCSNAGHLGFSYS